MQDLEGANSVLADAVDGDKAKGDDGIREEVRDVWMEMGGIEGTKA